MPKPNLGTKRTCTECSARFYDLQKSPVECPKCGHTFDPEVLLKPRRQRAEPKPAAAEKPAEVETEEEEETPDAKELTGDEQDAALMSDDEQMAEEEETPGQRASSGLEDDGLVEIEDEEDLIDDNDEGDDIMAPLEDEEEEEDVTGIVDTKIGSNNDE